MNGPDYSGGAGSGGAGVTVRLNRTTGASVQPTLSLITDVQIRQWGREITIHGLDDPSTRHPLQLVFRDCEEIRWTSHDCGTDAEVEADVIGLCPGHAGYAEPAVVTTDLFEVSIRYRSLDVEYSEISGE